MARTKRRTRISHSPVFTTAAKQSGSPIEPLEKRVLFTAINWIGAASGNFNVATNWSTSTVPGSGDQVTISAAAGVVVTVSDAESVESLMMTTPVVISSTTGNAALTIAGGGVSLGSTLQLGASDAVSSGALDFIGSESLNGTGTVLFAGTGSNPNQISVADTTAGSGSSLEIFGVTIHGSTGKIIGSSPDSSIFDISTTQEDGGGRMTLEGGTASNFDFDGAVGASNGVLDLEGAWANEGGTFTVSGTGTLDLGGTFSDNSANSVINTGGTVNITGTLQVSTGLELNSTTGSFNLDGGTIEPSSSSDENIINADSSVSLVMTAAGGTLNDMQLGVGDPLNAAAGGVLITNSLTLNSTTINLGGTINFTGTQLLGGTGTVVDLAGTMVTTGGGTATTASTLTIGSGIGINGGDGTISGVNTDDSITSTGTIGISAGGTLTIKPGAGGTFDNEGTLSASNGTLNLQGNWANGGPLIVTAGAALQLGGTFTSNDTSFINSSGGVVNITGTLSIEGTMNLNATTGSFNLDGGTIIAADGRIISTDGTAAVVLTSAGGTLNGIQLGNGSPLNASAGTVNILNNLNSEETQVTVGGTILFSGSQILTGGGTFTLAGGALEAVGNGGTTPADLNIVSGVIINGASGSIEGINAGDTITSDATIDVNAPGAGINIHGGTNGGFNNQGPISAEGGTLNITGQWVNLAPITATAGAILNLGDQTPATTNLWSNVGVINSLNSEVNLGGDLTNSALGQFNRSGGTVSLTGMFDLQGTTQTFNQGSWNLQGATVNATGAQLNTSNGQLVLTAAGGTVEGGLTLGPGSPVDASAGTATIVGGLTLTNTTLTVGNALTFSGTQTIGGTGSVLLNNGKLEALGGVAGTVGSAATLTIGTNVNVIATAGTIGGINAGDSVINDGLINSSTAGDTITFISNGGGTITNAGTLSLAPLSAMSINGDLTNTATSTLEDAVDATGIGSLNITGTFNEAGTFLLNVPGAFVPPQGQVYTVANYSATTGAFAEYDGLTPPSAVLTPTAGATSLTLTTTFGAYSGLRPTVTTAVSSNQNASAGGAVTFVATVTAPAGAGTTPTGTVSFFLNGAAFGTAPVAADETATFTTTALPVGRLMIAAIYSGDTTYASSASPVLGETIANPVESIGGLTPTFGIQGLATHAVGFTTTSGLAVSASGQSIVAGTIGTAPNESFGITRYNADGTLDTTFGTGGVTSYTFGSTDDQVSAVAVLPTGQLLVAGTATTYVAGVATGSEFAIAEFNADGTLDAAFGNGTGEVLTSFSTITGVLSNDVVHALIVSATGTIYLGGSSDAAGKGEDFAIASYTASGTPFAGFNGGQTTLDFSGGDDQINSLAIQGNGDVVAGGFATIGTAQIALARFLPTGVLDKHFGTLGTITTNVRGVFDSAASVVIQPKGQIIIGGVSATGSGTALSADFVLARYTAAGRIDRTFGGGPVITSFGQPSAITQLVLETDGEIIASGKTTASLTSVDPSMLDVAIARYTAAGALDTTFNGTGKTIIDLSGTVAPTDIRISAFSDMQIEPLAASTLGSAFDQFISSQQGVVATTTGGAILTAGNSGSNTVEAQLIILGVDLVADVVSALPTAVPGGMKGTATITIGENGTTLAKGTVTIQLQVATDAQGDGALSIKAYAEKVNLRQGGSHAFKLAFIFPAGIPSNNYFLLATVLDGSTLNDLNANNNTALSTHTVNISPPTTVLTGSALTATTIFTPGKPAGVAFDLTNAGNITAHGRITVELFVSTNEITTDGSQIPAAPLVVSLAAGKSHLYKLRGVLPASVVAGNFDLLLLIDPANSLGATDHSDSLVTGTVTVG